MSILVDKNTKVIVQGITGKQGRFHTQEMIEYGTQIVGGVTPGKGGTECLGVPVFNTVRAAKDATGATVSVIFVPAKFAAESILEAADAGMDLCVCITEGIPVQDMMRVKHVLKESNTVLIGPNCPGLITPSECKVGIIPGNICRRDTVNPAVSAAGSVGIISRSGTLTYEAINQLTERGLGQSTAIGIGGDSIRGISFVDALEMFYNDPETTACVMIGEIGGSEEEKAAEWIRGHQDMPVVFYISGRNAPPGKRMGHAGAIIEGGHGTADSKIAALEAAGAINAGTPDMIGETMLRALQ
ncbi:MAG: succinate--CoA ligase subunit alpha [Mogibacterium sp.]|nr:succinate--CoA ligase subunit alpha [Mogibacterium sp.]